MRHIILSCLLLLIATASLASSLKFSSGENRTHLIELYSSEGCSSCPPAERWLGELHDAPGLWRDFVPVAFHVSYWDRLGWPDRFANKEFTARQYAYSRQWHSGSVYTPEFVLNGEEWRARQTPTASTEKVGVLSVEYTAEGECEVMFPIVGDGEVHVALLGAGISSVVRAGENRGRTLRHDFVVLELKSVRLVNGRAELRLPKSSEPDIPRQALALWVTRRGELTPLQATGGWLN